MVAAIVFSTVSFGLSGYNTFTAISDRRWSRQSERRQSQKEFRDSIRNDLDELSSALDSIPEMKMGFYGYPSVPAPPESVSIISRRLAGAADRIEGGLRTALMANAPRIIQYLEHWNRAYENQANEPVRSSSSDKDVNKLLDSVTARSKMGEQYPYVGNAISEIIVALNAADREL